MSVIRARMTSVIRAREFLPLSRAYEPVICARDSVIRAMAGSRYCRYWFRTARSNRPRRHVGTAGHVGAPPPPRRRAAAASWRARPRAMAAGHLKNPRPYQGGGHLIPRLTFPTDPDLGWRGRMTDRPSDGQTVSRPTDRPKIMGWDNVKSWLRSGESCVSCFARRMASVSSAFKSQNLGKSGKPSIGRRAVAGISLSMLTNEP